MSKFQAAAKRFGGFMKRNAFYFLIVLCIASVATVIALAVTRPTVQTPDSSLSADPTLKPEQGEQKEPTQETPAEPEKKLTFISPCNGTVKNGYSAEALVWNPSLSQYEVHPALDFVSSDQNVYAAADGKVKEIGYNTLEGNFIVIEHDDGYMSKYLSLATESALKVGGSVKQGQLIGKMSKTQGNECSEQDHLHFELYKDNELINPLEVLVLDEK